jgi:arylsulfatase A-like enzyme
MFAPATPAWPIPESAIDRAVRIEGSRDVHVYRARYDACVREVDDSLGAFFGEVRAAGAWDRSAVIVTADHGEEFFEHQHMGHNTDLFDTQVHVPLLMKVPGVAPRRVSMVAQLLDLYPTLVAIAGGHTSASHGTDLLPSLRGQNPPERYAFAELPGSLWAVRTRHWKLISHMPGAGRLYHLADDPRELTSVTGAWPQQASRLEHALVGMMSIELRDGEKVVRRQVPMDPRIVEQLHALGYLSGQ